MPITPLQKALRNKDQALKKAARGELAKRLPQHAHEIRNFEWDNSVAMQQVIVDLKRMGM